MCFLSTTFPNAPAHPSRYILTGPLSLKKLTWCVCCVYTKKDTVSGPAVRFSSFHQRETNVVKSLLCYACACIRRTKKDTVLKCLHFLFPVCPANVKLKLNDLLAEDKNTTTQE